MSEQDGRYYARAWRLFSADKGWMKPLLVMGAASLVPVVGPLGVDGYGLEWARLVAWGADAHPKQKHVDVGGCIKSGWRGFLVGIVYALVLWAVSVPLSRAVGDGSLGQLVLVVLDILVGAIISIAQIRSAIYQNFIAGYRVDRIWDMLKRDAGGFFKIVGATIVMGVCVGLVMALIGFAVLGSYLGTLLGLIGMGSGHMGYLLADQIASVVGSMVPALVIVLYIATTATSWMSVMTAAMFGLWMRQFSVPLWGASGDPLPKAASQGAPGASGPGGSDGGL